MIVNKTRWDESCGIIPIASKIFRKLEEVHVAMTMLQSSFLKNFHLNILLGASMSDFLGFVHELYRREQGYRGL